jgi:hypothetical protein
MCLLTTNRLKSYLYDCNALERLMRKSLAITASILLLWANSLVAKTSIPIQLNYPLIKNILTKQLFTGQNQSAQLWHDKHGCSFLNIANPKISGQQGQIRLLNDVQAELGTRLSGQCLTVLKWDGLLETLQQPTISADHTVLTLPVTKATAYDHTGHAVNINKLQDLITKVAAPKLANVKVDLNQSRSDIEKTLLKFLPKQNAPQVKTIVNSLVFDSINADDKGITLQVAFDAPPALASTKTEAPLTGEELKQWQATWQQWDSFLTKAIKQANMDSQSPQLRKTLTNILAKARTAFQAGLKQHDRNNDPVRIFFSQTWQQLSPELQTLSQQLPEVKALRYATFIAATDVIYELDKIGAPLGLQLSSDGLRHLARLLIATKTAKTKPTTP